MKWAMLAVVAVLAAGAARAETRETLVVSTFAGSTVVVASDAAFTAVAPVTVSVCTIRPLYVKKVVWVEPSYVMECWDGHWVKAYKPGHYKEVWVKAGEA